MAFASLDVEDLKLALLALLGGEAPQVALRDVVVVAGFRHGDLLPKNHRVAEREEAYRRLSRYREGVRRSEDSGSRLEVGQVFQEFCGLPINLASLGTNTFTTVFEHAAAMLIAWDIDFEAGSPN